MPLENDQKWLQSIQRTVTSLYTPDTEYVPSPTTLLLRPLQSFQPFNEQPDTDRSNNRAQNDCPCDYKEDVVVPTTGEDGIAVSKGRDQETNLTTRHHGECEDRCRVKGQRLRWALGNVLVRCVGTGIYRVRCG